MQDVYQGNKKEWAKVIGQAWADEEFKGKLLADPKPVLKEYGIEFPENAKVTVLEMAENEVTLPLPPKPADFSVPAEEVLERIQASTF
ncbi:hypothetical protein LCGC14_2427610 [marine sediment metagenome]|uniref:Nitrile hydratase alpha /Thiocyanate hydrolase gamma domain-containing protein n=1 Tax=marine sediment metagenome TaxID=412755 RepID=A0A0F9CA61_9ZZZZ